MQSPDAFLAEYRDVLAASAALNAELESLEEQRKRVLAQEIVAQGDAPVAKAEHAARAGERYGAFLQRLGDVRGRAAAAGAKAEYMRVRWETWRTTHADRRRQ